MFYVFPCILCDMEIHMILWKICLHTFGILYIFVPPDLFEIIWNRVGFPVLYSVCMNSEI